MDPSSLEIRLLGELTVLRAGRPVVLPASKKTRALLGYLVVCGSAGGALPRSRLCELFWEGPLDPRAALRWSLTKLRPLLDDGGERRLVGDRERVGFAPAGAALDLAAVHGAVAGGLDRASTAALCEAVSLFRGELLEGLELPDCYRYREWLLAEREALRSLRRSILAALVIRLRETPAEALRHARAWVGIDPLDEPAQAAVIRLLGELGQVREAQAQYESCRRMLREELGTAPSEEVEEARRGLTPLAPLSHRPPFRRERGEIPRTASELLGGGAPLPGAGGAMGEGLGVRPLVGRARERAELAALLDAAARGEGGTVLLVSGEPGMGKSRLLAELADLARSRGGTVLSGRSFEAEMVRPYGAWIDALRSIPLGDAVAPFRRELAPLLSELGPAPPAAAGDRGRLFDAVHQLLGGIGESTAPTVVVLDDLHWLDDASAALLHYVARAGAGSLLLACAARPGELADNPAALALVRALGREGRLHPLELAPLSAEETAELVRGVVAAAEGERAFAESGGNPLFALEVARALARGEGTLSDSLSGLLRERLERLDGRAREILPWAAALGRGFAAELLASATGLPPSELLAGLGELERHGILRPSRETALDFSHDLLRQAAYRQLSEPRRRLIHRQIARVLAALPDVDGALAGDVAHHAGLGGDDELAVAAAVRAGERCLRLFAPAEAAEVAERALPFVRHLPRDRRLCLHVNLLKIYVHSSLGRRHAPELERELASLVAQAEEVGLHAEVQTGLYLLSVLSEEGGNFAAAETHSLRAVEATRDADPATAVRALANTGRCLAQLEREPRRAEALLAEAAELARELNGHQGHEVIDLPWGLGLCHLFAGRDEEAARSLERALQMARHAGEHWAECECMARLAMLDLEAGRPALALARVPELAAVAAKLGEGSEGPLAEALAALACLALGAPGAEERLEAALAILRDIDTKGLLAYVQNLAAEIDLAAGRPGRAAQRAEEALRAASVVDRRSQIALARAALAEAALAAGDRETAAAHLRETAGAAADPHRLNARARRAVERAREALGAR